MDVLGFEERGIHLALMHPLKMDSRFRGNDGLEAGNVPPLPKGERLIQH